MIELLQKSFPDEDKDATTSLGNLESLSSSRRPSFFSNAVHSKELNDRELRFLFKFNDKDSKGYLSKEEFWNLIERIRKRDRVSDPLSPAVLDSIFFLLDPQKTYKIPWDIFQTRFNDVFYKNRFLYYTDTAPKPHGVFRQTGLSPRSRRASSASLSPTQPLVAAELKEINSFDISNPSDISIMSQQQETVVVPSQKIQISSIPPTQQQQEDIIMNVDKVRHEQEQNIMKHQYAKSILLPKISYNNNNIPQSILSQNNLVSLYKKNDNSSPLPHSIIESPSIPIQQTSLFKPSLIPRKPPPLLPKHLQLDIQLPNIHQEHIASQLCKNVNQPGFNKNTRWVGRIPFNGNICNVKLKCPHCNESIDPIILEQQWKDSTGPYKNFKNDELFNTTNIESNFGFVPLYGPYFYSGMWETGKAFGAIPPSFFSSPYNLHTWTPIFTNTTGIVTPWLTSLSGSEFPYFLDDGYNRPNGTSSLASSHQEWGVCHINSSGPSGANILFSGDDDGFTRQSLSAVFDSSQTHELFLTNTQHHHHHGLDSSLVDDGCSDPQIALDLATTTHIPKVESSASSSSSRTAKPVNILNEALITTTCTNEPSSLLHDERIQLQSESLNTTYSLQNRNSTSQNLEHHHHHQSSSTLLSPSHVSLETLKSSSNTKRHHTIMPLCSSSNATTTATTADFAENKTIPSTNNNNNHNNDHCNRLSTTTGTTTTTTTTPAITNTSSSTTTPHSHVQQSSAAAAYLMTTDTNFTLPTFTQFQHNSLHDSLIEQQQRLIDPKLSLIGKTFSSSRRRRHHHRREENSPMNSKFSSGSSRRHHTEFYTTSSDNNLNGHTIFNNHHHHHRHHGTPNEERRRGLLVPSRGLLLPTRGLSTTAPPSTHFLLYNNNNNNTTTQQIPNTTMVVTGSSAAITHNNDTNKNNSLLQTSSLSTQASSSIPLSHNTMIFQPQQPSSSSHMSTVYGYYNNTHGTPSTVRRTSTIPSTTTTLPNTSPTISPWLNTRNSCATGYVRGGVATSTPASSDPMCTSNTNTNSIVSNANIANTITTTTETPTSNTYGIALSTHIGRNQDDENNLDVVERGTKRLCLQVPSMNKYNNNNNNNGISMSTAWISTSTSPSYHSGNCDSSSLNTTTMNTPPSSSLKANTGPMIAPTSSIVNSTSCVQVGSQAINTHYSNVVPSCPAATSLTLPSTPSYHLHDGELLSHNIIQLSSNKSFLETSQNSNVRSVPAVAPTTTAAISGSYAVPSSSSSSSSCTSNLQHSRGISSSVPAMVTLEPCHNNNTTTTKSNLDSMKTIHNNNVSSNNIITTGATTTTINTSYTLPVNNNNDNNNNINVQEESKHCSQNILTCQSINSLIDKNHSSSPRLGIVMSAEPVVTDDIIISGNVVNAQNNNNNNNDDDDDVVFESCRHTNETTTTTFINNLSRPSNQSPLPTTVNTSPLNHTTTNTPHQQLLNQQLAKIDIKKDETFNSNNNVSSSLQESLTSLPLGTSSPLIIPSTKTTFSTQQQQQHSHYDSASSSSSPLCISADGTNIKQQLSLSSKPSPSHIALNQQGAISQSTPVLVAATSSSPLLNHSSSTPLFHKQFSNSISDNNNNDSTVFQKNEDQHRNSNCKNFVSSGSTTTPDCTTIYDIRTSSTKECKIITGEMCDSRDKLETNDTNETTTIIDHDIHVTTTIESLKTDSEHEKKHDDSANVLTTTTTTTTEISKDCVVSSTKEDLPCVKLELNDIKKDIANKTIELKNNNTLHDLSPLLNEKIENQHNDEIEGTIASAMALGLVSVFDVIFSEEHRLKQKQLNVLLTRFLPAANCEASVVQVYSTLLERLLTEPLRTYSQSWSELRRSQVSSLKTMQKQTLKVADVTGVLVRCTASFSAYLDHFFSDWLFQLELQGDMNSVPSAKKAVYSKLISNYFRPDVLSRRAHRIKTIESLFRNLPFVILKQNILSSVLPSLEKTNSTTTPSSSIQKISVDNNNNSNKGNNNHPIIQSPPSPLLLNNTMPLNTTTTTTKTTSNIVIT